jgi:hypothetical protein
MVNRGSPLVISLLSDDEGESSRSSSSSDESQGSRRETALSARFADTGAGQRHRGSTSSQAAAGGEGAAAAAAAAAAPELKHSLFACSGGDATEEERSPLGKATAKEPRASNAGNMGYLRGLGSDRAMMAGKERFSERSGQGRVQHGEEHVPGGETSQQNDSSPVQRDLASNDTSSAASPVTDDPLFRTDNVLSSIEMELAWLGEESRHCLVAQTFQFAFVWEYASEGLRVELRKVVRDESVADTEDWYREVIRDDWLVRRRFEIVREKIRNFLRRGQRREVMARVIAEVRLRQRKLGRGDRSFPPIGKLSHRHVPAPRGAPPELLTVNGNEGRALHDSPVPKGSN